MGYVFLDLPYDVALAIIAIRDARCIGVNVKSTYRPKSIINSVSGVTI